MALYHKTPKGALLGGRPEEGDIIRGSRQGTGSSIGQSIMGANRITPRPEDGGIPPVSDNVAGSLSSNAKAQSLGENLWEGEAFAEQRALRRQAAPVPTPGSEFDEYGGMFSQPLAQSGKIKEANKQRRQDRRDRKKEIKKVGVENFSIDGYHTGEYNKKGVNIDNPEKRYSRKNPPPLNQSGDPVADDHMNYYKSAKNKDEKRFLVEHSEQHGDEYINSGVSKETQKTHDSLVGVSNKRNNLKEFNLKKK
tara:strand:+ start:66 stop:818 length:753 start_codon:yes stop_codon:yes gene_type:complete